VKARAGVVSSAHLARLAGMLNGVAVPPDLAEARDTWRPGLSVFAVHAALRDDIGFPTREGSITSAAGGFGSSAGIARQMAAFERGEADATDPWLLAVDQTAVDPSRAPGGGATFKILTVAPYERADGRSWEEAKQEYAEAVVGVVRARTSGLEPENILALRAESPVDVAAYNAHNLGGSCHGGEFLTPAGEVIPGWLVAGPTCVTDRWPPVVLGVGVVRDNPTWGYRRICSELSGPGHTPSPRRPCERSSKSRPAVLVVSSSRSRSCPSSSRQ
jgi:hypothetical protein